jgi:hypothetical protein
MRRQMKGPRFHRVLVVDEVNAAVVQRPAFGLVGWPRNHLLLGLPLLEALSPTRPWPWWPTSTATWPARTATSAPSSTGCA